jgi:3-hydroxyacyl-CoA dehydrogenase
MREGIVESVRKAEADASVHAIVLRGAGKAFSAGADIKEFNTPKATAEPSLRTAIRIIESCEKPVVAAIGGVCMGGGFELALGCHFRVASPDATLALPEVNLGLLPGAGGTQRLPRAIGVENALNMIVSGATVPVKMLAETGLIDAIVDGDLSSGAVEFARKIVAEARPMKRLRDVKLDFPDREAFFAFARNMVRPMARNLPAPLKCIDAVEAATTMKIDDGLVRERELFVDLVNTSQSKALRHAFFAERAASKVSGIDDSVSPRRIERVAIIGAGTMGGGIAMNFLSAGIPVTILEAKQEALDKGVKTIRGNYEATQKKGRLKAEQVEKAMGLLTPTMSFDALAGADLFIEAVFEDMGVKEEVFRKIDQVAKKGAILATNTSTLDVDRIAAVTSRPQDVLGLHFFSPANVMKLLEIVRGAKTAPDLLVTAMQLAKKIRKTAVMSGVCDGFIGNRMLESYVRQTFFMVEEGASPREVDNALEAFGMAMGPFRVADLVGNDIPWSIRKRRYVEKPNIVYSRIADRICELGRFGQKTGKGWYRYEPGRRDAIADPEVDALIAAYRKEKGITPRELGKDEIVERAIYALVNEGARILEEGIAQRASDIDVVYLTGYGFPRWRGGPMFYADSVGLYNVVDAIGRFAKASSADPGFWTPAPLLAKLASEGGTFNR